MTFNQFALLAVITGIITIITSLGVHIFKWWWDNPKIKNIAFISQYPNNITIVNVKKIILEKEMEKASFDPIRVKMSDVTAMIIIKNKKQIKVIVTEVRSGTLIYVLKDGGKIPWRMSKINKKIQ